jgi:hypothetical protein
MERTSPTTTAPAFRIRCAGLYYYPSENPAPGTTCAPFNHVVACFNADCSDQTNYLLDATIAQYSGYAHTILGTTFA